MQRISVSELSTSRWSFFQDAIRYAEHGFESIGIWRSKFDDFDEQDATQLLFETQLNVSSVHWAGSFTGSDGRSLTDAIADGKQAIELTSRVRGDCLIVHPGGRNGHTLTHANRLFCSAMDSLLPIAEDHDVRLAIEPILDTPGSCWTFLRSLDDNIRMINRFGKERLGLVIDLYHTGLHVDAFERLAEYADSIALVQLADRKQTMSEHTGRRLLGEGHVPIATWLGRLQELAYTGQYEIEIHGCHAPADDYSEMLTHCNNFLSSQPIASVIHTPGTETERRDVKRSSSTPDA